MTTDSIRLFDDAEHDASLPDMPVGFSADDSMRFVDSQLQALGCELGAQWQAAASYYVRRCKRPASVVVAAVWQAYKSHDATKANVQTYLRRAILNEMALEKREGVGAYVPNGCGIKTGKGRHSGAGAFVPASVARLDAENADDDGETSTLHDVIPAPSVNGAAGDILDAMRDSLASLPEETQRILDLLFGLSSGEPLGLKEVAAILALDPKSKVTFQRIAQIKDKALDTLHFRMTHATE